MTVRKGAAAAAEREMTSPAREMTSPVYWAVLGLVIERPSYGYELSRRFDSEYDGLTASTSHIYAALGVLEDRGFVEEVPGSRRRGGTKRQPKWRVRATAQGMRCFYEWLVAQVGEDRRRSSVFARQLAVFAREPEMALSVISHMEQSNADEARSAPIASPRRSGVDPVSGLVERLTAEERRLALAGRVPWVQYARREFEELARLKHGRG
jgi:DNA-binding PadR family transcriptional regulator